MAEQGDAFSRNPNMCASCSSMLDGMPESSVSSFPDFADKNSGREGILRVEAESLTAFAPGMAP
jgi:hypothetical protein